MPIESSATYIPLDGSGRAGCWGERTGLEKRLIFLSVILAVVVFTVSIAFALRHCEAPNPTPNGTTASVPPTGTSGAPTKSTSPSPSTSSSTAAPTSSTKPLPPTKPSTTSSTTTSTPSPPPASSSTGSSSASTGHNSSVSSASFVSSAPTVSSAVSPSSVASPASSANSDSNLKSSTPANLVPLVTSNSVSKPPNNKLESNSIPESNSIDEKFQ